MRQLLRLGLLCFLMMQLNQVIGQTTCNPADFDGPNLVVNSDFSAGNTGFTTTLTRNWNTTGPHGFSTSGDYWVSTNANPFNPGGNFQGTAKVGSNFLMVDGACPADPSITPYIWRQTINVEPNTNYYFGVSISTIAPPPNSPGRFRFRINGITQDTVVIAPNNVNIWETYEQVWFSGATSGAIEIEIIDVYREFNADCSGSNVNDYGIDDIVFKKGCPFGAPGPVSDLDPYVTLCGTNGTVTLDTKIPSLEGDETVYWSTGTHDNQVSIDVTTSGMYYVCTAKTGSCTRVDSAFVDENYSISLGVEDVEFCDQVDVTLDAGHQGNGVSYEWYKDNTPIPGATSKTLYVNEIGTYKVIVDDPTCDTQEDEIIVKQLRTTQPNPTNVGFCLRQNPDTTITFNVSPAGTNYVWYDVITGGTPLAGGIGVDEYTLSGITNTGATLYVQDNTDIVFPSIGPKNTGAVIEGWDLNTHGAFAHNRNFNPLNDLIIRQVSVRTNRYQGPCNGKDTNTPSDNYSIVLYENGIPTTQSVTVSTPCHVWADVTLNFTAEAGKNYSLHTNVGNGWFFVNGEKEASTIPGIIEIPEKTGTMPDTRKSGVFFNWIIESKSNCQRAPVIAFDNCILPVEFYSLNASNVDNNVLIEWTTTWERNNNYFEIWKSIDGINFTLIHTIDSKGNSEAYQQYTWIDKSNTNSDYVYYKIKQVDYDGGSEWSNIVGVPLELKDVEFFPNPFDHEITIRLNEYSEGNYKIKILDLVGRILLEEKTNVNESKNIGKLLPNGTYLLEIINNDQRISVNKIIKQ